MAARALRTSDLRFLLGLLLPALTLQAVLQRPHTAAFGAFLVFVLIAVLEAAWPRLAHSPAPVSEAPPLRWLLRAFVPLEVVLIAAGCAVAAQAEWKTVVGLGFAVGLVTGAQGITYAHELGHSRSRADRALAWVLMGCVAYPQFMVEHYRGHHVRAATWNDPASARSGESLWAFLPRTLAGSLRSAWALESVRLVRYHRSWLASPLAWWTAANVALVAVLASSGAWKVLAFWAVQCAFAVWLLETVNYIEHYGLQRRVRADGRPEPFGIEHAWNADHLLSNSLLANLQRHSDHHVNAWKAFPQLQPLPGPQLPTGYAGCVLLATLPPLWFALMQRRLPARAQGVVQAQ